MQTSEAIDLFRRFVVPSYSRFPLLFTHGKGTHIWDADGKDYLDFGSGIAVTTLGHAHPELSRAIAKQAETLIHTSNLYYTEPQGRLAEKIVSLVGPGKCFFSNSGAESNEALFKLARKFGHDNNRYEILTAHNSFHGRTLAGIAATGQDKVKKGFEPAVEGFRHIVYNDLKAVQDAVSDKTIAVLIEGVQGESGIQPASVDYLLGLRKFCTERKLLMLMDAVQCGMFRTGRFQSFQRILESCKENGFLPDAISMAKGIGGGIPMGAVWIHESLAELFGPGTHATTFGGTPLACAAALAVFDVVQKEKLDENARKSGDYLKSKLIGMKSPHVKEVRGLGLMIGIEMNPNIASLTAEGVTPAAKLVVKLHEAGLLTVPAGNQTVRLLPPLIITQKDCDEALSKLDQVFSKL
jgi:acetylornithine/N-succinyldiaminopimelate aminotransferase